LKPFLLFFLLSPLSVSAQDSIARTELVPILRAVHDTLANHHPFAFVANGKQELKETLTDILQQADSLLASRSGDSLAYPEVSGLAAPLQVTVGCGHTYLRRKSTADHKKRMNSVRSAISAFRVTDGSYVLNSKLATTKDSLERGTEILALNNRPIAPLVNSLSRFFGVNDHNYLPATAYIISSSLGYYYRNVYGHQDTLSVTVRTKAGDATHLVPLKPLIRSKTKGKPKKKKTPPFSLTINEGKTGAHLRIVSFNGASWKGFKANKEVAKIIAELREKDIDNLVIDLRGNLGGSLNRMRDIYRNFATEPFAAISKMESLSPDAKPNNPFHSLGTYLIGGRRRMPGGGYHRPRFYKEVKPLKEKKGYRGKLAVLINERTFSAATLFAHLVQATGRGELVGATSGGSTNQTYGGSFEDYPIGAAKQFDLHIPDYGIQPWRPQPGNLKPDHFVGYTAEDVAAGRDTRLEFAYELLEGK